MIVWFVVAIEHVEVADDRVADGMGGVDRLLQQLPQHVLPIDLAVGQLAADDLQLALELGRLELDVLHRVGHQFDGRHRVLGGAIDEEGRHVGRGEGVGGPAEGVDDLLDLLFAAVRGAAAGHDVFQHVAQAGARGSSPRRRCRCS